MNRLSELRIEKKLKQSELAKLVNTTQQTISAYERDLYVQKDSALEQRLADFFACSIDYLRGLSNIRNSEEYIKDSILLADEFRKIGIIGENEDISDELLEYFRNLIELNKPFLSSFSKTKKSDENNNEESKKN